MEKQYEITAFDAKNPIRLFFYETTGVFRHCHPEIELILLLEGSARLFDGERTTLLSEGEIALINSNFPHELISDEKFSFISLNINTREIGAGLENKIFECNSSEDNDKGKYYPLKHYIAQIAKINSAGSENTFFLNRALMYTIFYKLCENFTKDPATSKIQSDKYLMRLNRIVSYIDEHYREGLTLQSLARSEHLTVSYLSNFFEKYFGVNFLTYYNELRLSRTVNELLSSDESIEVIAINNGFTNPRTFLNLFKKKYGAVPSAYRKEYNAKNGKTATKNETRSVIYGNDDYTNTPLGLLAKYLSPEPETKAEPSISKNIALSPKTVRVEKISCLNAKKALRHTFKTLLCVGRAKEILYADIQSMLREIQHDIGYEYINFHGLLSDDMLLYRENSKGEPKYSFIHLDKVLDFLRSVNLKPFIHFGFMPKALASDTGKTIFANEFILSPPKDSFKWEKLIKTVCEHFLEKYGLKTVKTWRFSVWNEPDISSTLFSFENPEDFFELYKITYDAVKSVNKNLIFGSPSLQMRQFPDTRQWYMDFISFCKTNNCMPDFMNLHFYDNDFSDSEREAFSNETLLIPNLKVNRDEGIFKKSRTKIFQLFKETGIGNLPVYLTEWNLTVSHRNLLNDTCFKSCYIIKHLLENYDSLDSFGYWMLSDFIEETQLPDNIFHGGLGLFTYNGVKKAHYHALALLSHLGDRLIKQGDGYFITKSHGKIQIMLYNYEHFNHLYASGETFDPTFAERYTPFSKLGKMEIALELTDIPVKKCVIRESIINQQNGSAFDIWMTLNIKQLQNRDIGYIKNLSVPQYRMREEPIENETLLLNTLLEPLEVRLIEIDLKI